MQPPRCRGSSLGRGRPGHVQIAVQARFVGFILCARRFVGLPPLLHFIPCTPSRVKFVMLSRWVAGCSCFSFVFSGRPAVWRGPARAWSSKGTCRASSGPGTLWSAGHAAPGPGQRPGVASTSTGSGRCGASWFSRAGRRPRPSGSPLCCSDCHRTALWAACGAACKAPAPGLYARQVPAHFLAPSKSLVLDGVRAVGFLAGWSRKV
jgi:hypothetical protein